MSYKLIYQGPIQHIANDQTVKIQWNIMSENDCSAVYNNAYIRRQQVMKYSCQNCNTCCISTSPQVSYCGTLSECNPSHVPYTEAVGLTVLTIFLLASVLVILYFAFKDRKLGSSQEKQEEAMEDEIKAKSKAIVSQKVEDKKETIKSKSKVTGQLSINSKISKKSKSNRTRTSKSLKKTETATETERGLR